MDADRFSLIQDYQMTFGTPHGQRVLAHLERVVCKVNDLTFVCDPYHNAMKQGKRFVFLEIKQKLDVDLSKPEQVDAISKELP